MQHVWAQRQANTERTRAWDQRRPDEPSAIVGVGVRVRVDADIGIDAGVVAGIAAGVLVSAASVVQGVKSLSARLFVGCLG